MGIKVKYAASIVVLSALFAGDVSAQAKYDYPYLDPWVATVSSALIRDPKNTNAQQFSIRLKLNGALARSTVPYRLYQNPKNSVGDLVILIPGIGTNVDGDTPNFLASNMYKVGHQVLIVPNDFTVEFMMGASTTGIVGLPSGDAADMRNLICHILKTAKKLHGLNYSSLSLVGYSLGALQSAFVSYQDSLLTQTDKKKINISKTVLINSPIDLWNAIQVLDQIGSLANTIPLETKLDIDAIAVEIGFDDWDVKPTDPNYYLILNSYLPRPEVDFQYLIGDNFYDALAKVAPPGVVGFTNYLQAVVLPSLGGQNGEPTTLEAMAAQESLTSLKSYLQANPNIFLMHNEDDFLLQPTDMQFINDAFSNRATLYPHGGHLGNLWYPQNVTDLNARL